MTLKEKILSGIELSGEEVEQVLTRGVEGIKFIDSIFEEHNRWSLSYSVILQIEDQYFLLWYQEAATEMQDDWYPEQIAVEVVNKPVMRNNWVSKLKND